MEKKNINRVVVAVVAVALIVAIIGGATFAYWQWITNTSQQTAVNVTVAQGINMTIEPTTVNTNTLHPTNIEINTIEGGNTAIMKSTALVSIENQTGILARPKFMLKLKITNSDGSQIITNSNNAGDSKKYREYIRYAVTEENGSCDTPITAGTFNGNATATGNGFYNSPYLTLDTYDTANSTNAPDGFPDLTSENPGSVSFNANAYVTTEHTYKVCVWLDSSYTFTNEGNAVTDPMQNAIITVTWSDDSEVIQVTG